MTLPPAIAPWVVLATLALVLAAFVWGRFRYEAVALTALVGLVLLGLIPAGEAFAGIGHPAVVTVAAVLVISQALANAGVVDVLGKPLAGLPGGPALLVLALTALVAILSAFMNNVGALALLMPVAMQLCRQRELPASLVLMPMAFGSLLGGLMTAIGTPPNLIVAEYRGGVSGTPFALFDFLPLGGAVAVAGVAFLALLGWRWLPQRAKGEGDTLAFSIDGYRSEVKVPDEHRWVGLTLREVAAKLGEGVTLLTVVRGERRIPLHHRYERLATGDRLLIEAEAEALKAAVESHGLDLAGRGEAGVDALPVDEDTQIVEAVILPDSRLVQATAAGANLRWRYGVNLLAVSRQGQAVRTRLSRLPLQAGDVLLLEGERESLAETLATLGCLPLADRALRIGTGRRVLAGLGLFGAAIAAAALGLAPIHVSFTACALLMAGVGMINGREVYRAIDWPIVLLLGAMIPIGRALETSGGAALIAEALGGWASGLPPIWGLAAILVITMFLSDIVNNAAAAVLMCPIAAGLAGTLGVSADPFLMAVALGASCAFLTPVGHQSNTLVMGPGGYRFGDYWRVGLPLQTVVAAVALMLLPLFWPF